MDSSVLSAQPAIEQIDDQPNLLMGLIGGVIAMLVGAVVWGAITYFTQYQIGYAAIGVGFLVGIAVKFFGRGKSMVFGISSAVLALLGCILGNFLYYTGAIAQLENASFLDMFFFLLLNPAVILEVFIGAFHYMDILFYALAIYAGFSTALDLRKNRK